MTEPVRDRLDWLLAHTGPDNVIAADVVDAFTAGFCAQVSVDRIVDFLRQMEGLDAGTIEQVSVDGQRLSADVSVGGERVRVMLAVEPDPPHRIAGVAVTQGPTLLDAADAEPVVGSPRDVIARALGPVAEEMTAGGMAVGVLAQGEQTIVALGDVPADAIFDVGSITKPCTGMLLASLVVDGVVSLDDPVAKFLPAGTRVPDDEGRLITLLDLATHSAGLPRMPAKFEPSDPQNPYADFTVDELYAALSETSLEFKIGTGVQYSNLGFGLLGHALGLAAGTPYRELIDQRIFAPLGMASTGVRSSSEVVPGLATPHLETGEPSAWWDVGAILGAGGIRSTAADLLRLAQANTDPSSTALADALELAQQPQIAEGERMRFGLGWVLLERLDGSTIVWHNGGTFGFHSFLALHRPSATAVVALANNGGVNQDAAAIEVLSALIASARS